MKYLGVDGCKNGWVIAVFEDNNFRYFDKVPCIDSLWIKYADSSCICIDIPIGLVDRGSEERKCDKVARSLLKQPRGSSVFSPPCRHTLKATSYEQACSINLKYQGKKISKQAWAIIPQIREVDVFLSRNTLAREVIREVHPEVCFWAFDQKPMNLNKKYKNGGFHERLALVQRHLPHIHQEFFAEERKRLKKIQYDDLMDALVAGLTATKKGFMRSLPHEPEYDSSNLPMRICYSDLKQMLH